MSARRKSRSSRHGSRGHDRRRSTGQAEPGHKSAIRLRRRPDEHAWELVHPRCARERAEDIEEVQTMIDAGEFEIARDELLWLIQDCKDFIEAHYLLGQLALIENDLPLARGHFGYAYRLGLGAVPAGKADCVLPCRLAANRAFFESGKGLAWSLEQLGKRDMALEVVDTLLALDPDNPLGLVEMKTRLVKRDEPAEG